MWHMSQSHIMWSYDTEKVIKDSRYYDLNLSNKVKEKSCIG